MTINPLDMYGPQFLVFYTIVGIVIFCAIRHRISSKEFDWRIPKLNLTDPYEIAFLRGGENEALRIATLSLIDRGLLDVSGNELMAKKRSTENTARRIIEKAILRKYANAGPAHEMYTDSDLKIACYEYKNSLEQNRLIASKAILASRLPLIYLGQFVLLGLAAAKLYVAIQRGRHNILFLIALAVTFSGSLFHIYFKKRTSLGDRVLADLRTLFKGLKARRNTIKAGGQTNEAALLAAVFGVTSLSTKSFPYVKGLFPKANSTDSCGTSCGSSSCGSSCSGGGCSSGCGGCGGD